MKEILEQIFVLDYTQYKGKVTGNGEEVRQCFKELKNELKPFVSQENLFIDWSIGQFRWAAIPWVRIYDKDISPETGSGVYIVYLFAESGQSVFVTLNQGVSKNSSEEIQQVKKNIQESISPGDFAINHGSIAELGDYADSTIFYKEYKRGLLPSDDEMKKDFNALVGIYKDYIKMKLNNAIEPDRINEPVPSKNRHEEKIKTIQTIFFGAPGTGKSHKIDYDLFKDENGSPIGKGIKEISEYHKFRTTFHPDYDYAQFVGAYKPKKCVNNITYSFVPQVFAKAYAAAWRLQLSDDANKNVFLVIEEINRGNCAQIFGDIFQLLDRDGDGFSQYSIDADCDFAEWLETDEKGLKFVWDKYKETVGEGKLKLPPNLNILATMNTSDQSLFPMDSAFKRRFDWEYVPISFDGKDAANFQIDVDGTQYSWQKFVETVNEKILSLTESEDKQFGEFFIKPDSGNVISKDRFLGKVMFYLWNEVCKDAHKNGSFFRTKDGDKEKYFTFQDLYRDKGLLKRFIEKLFEEGPSQE